MQVSVYSPVLSKSNSNSDSKTDLPRRKVVRVSAPPPQPQPAPQPDPTDTPSPPAPQQLPKQAPKRTAAPPPARRTVVVAKDAVMKSAPIAAAATTHKATLPPRLSKDTAVANSTRRPAPAPDPDTAHDQPLRITTIPLLSVGSSAASAAAYRSPRIKELGDLGAASFRVVALVSFSADHDLGATPKRASDARLCALFGLAPGSSGPADGTSLSASFVRRGDTDKILVVHTHRARTLHESFTVASILADCLVVDMRDVDVAHVRQAWARLHACMDMARDFASPRPLVLVMPPPHGKEESSLDTRTLQLVPPHASEARRAVTTAVHALDAKRSVAQTLFLAQTVESRLQRGMPLAHGMAMTMRTARQASAEALMQASALESRLVDFERSVRTETPRRLQDGVSLFVRLQTALRLDVQGAQACLSTFARLGAMHLVRAMQMHLVDDAHELAASRMDAELERAQTETDSRGAFDTAFRNVGAVFRERVQGALQPMFATDASGGGEDARAETAASGATDSIVDGLWESTRACARGGVHIRLMRRIEERMQNDAEGCARQLVQQTQNTDKYEPERILQTHVARDLDAYVRDLNRRLTHAFGSHSDRLDEAAAEAVPVLLDAYLGRVVDACAAADLDAQLFRHHRHALGDAERDRKYAALIDRLRHVAVVYEDASGKQHASSVQLVSRTRHMQMATDAMRERASGLVSSLTVDSSSASQAASRADSTDEAAPRLVRADAHALSATDGGSTSGMPPPHVAHALVLHILAGGMGVAAHFFVRQALHQIWILLLFLLVLVVDRVPDAGGLRLVFADEHMTLWSAASKAALTCLRARTAALGLSFVLWLWTRAGILSYPTGILSDWLYAYAGQSDPTIGRAWSWMVHLVVHASLTLLVVWALALARKYVHEARTRRTPEFIEAGPEQRARMILRQFETHHPVAYAVGKALRSAVEASETLVAYLHVSFESAWTRLRRAWRNRPRSMHDTRRMAREALERGGTRLHAHAKVGAHLARQHLHAGWQDAKAHWVRLTRQQHS